MVTKKLPVILIDFNDDDAEEEGIKMMVVVVTMRPACNFDCFHQ